MSKYTLKKQRFIEWLIDDHEDRVYFGRRFCNELIREHKINVTLEELFNERDYIPVHILEEYNDEWELDEDAEEEIDIDLIKLI
jgi:hypothetical protein